MTPYRLYNRIGSGGFVVEAALALAEADFELEELDSRPSTPLPESFRQHNPWRQVPTLILPNGSTMSETAAILIHLAACHPDKPLGPTPGTAAHAQFLRWMVFANVNVYEAILRRPYTERYTTDPNGLDAVREAATLRQGEALSVLEAEIATGPFLLGSDMTVLDVYVAMLLTWYNGDTAFLKLDTLKAGVPSSSLVCERFLGQAGTTSVGLGLPNLPVALVPGHVGTQGSEELAENVLKVTLDDVVKNLTNDPDAVAVANDPVARDIVFSGTIDEVNRLFIENEWSDGLPIIPPTAERVEAFLDFTDRDPEEVLAVLLPDSRAATIWSVAVNGVMAGCRPEYMPVLIALIEAMGDPKYGVEHSGNTPGGETDLPPLSGSIF